MPFCKYCGSEHDADAVFCTECGKPIVKKTVPVAEATPEVTPPVATPAPEPDSPAQTAPTTSKPPKKKKSKKAAWIIGISVAGVAIIAVAVFAFSKGAVQWPTLTEPPVAFSQDTDAIEAADASVVTIFCYDHNGELAATGSGFIAFDDRTVITNYHVMTSAYTCKISTNQDISYDVTQIMRYSMDYDIAILTLSQNTGIQPLTLSDSTTIKKGETVVAIGSPLGIKNTVSTGVLSGRLMEPNMDVLQFTAPISSGSSGGALFDDHGNVIGITYATIIDGQNLNLAVPAEFATILHARREQPQNVSYIYLEEHPHIAYLEAHKDIPEVTLTDLKFNPKKYDDKIVKLTTYVSSFYPDPDGEWTYCNLYVSEKYDVSFDADYDLDRIWNSKLDFEDTPCIECWLNDCAEPVDVFQAGDKIIVIGKFDYTAKGEKSGWRDYIYTSSIADIAALYIYVEP